MAYPHCRGAECRLIRSVLARQLRASARFGGDRVFTISSDSSDDDDAPLYTGTTRADGGETSRAGAARGARAAYERAAKQGAKRYADESEGPAVDRSELLPRHGAPATDDDAREATTRVNGRLDEQWQQRKRRYVAPQARAATPRPPPPPPPPPQYHHPQFRRLKTGSREQCELYTARLAGMRRCASCRSGECDGVCDAYAETEGLKERWCRLAERERANSRRLGLDGDLLPFDRRGPESNAVGQWARLPFQLQERVYGHLRPIAGQAEPFRMTSHDEFDDMRNALSELDERREEPRGRRRPRDGP
jgi:hypothetical protein